MFENKQIDYLKALSLPCTFEVAQEYDFTYLPTRVLCCGAGHYGCEKFIFKKGSIVTLTEFISNSDMSCPIPWFKLTCENEEFSFPIYRLSRIIKFKMFHFTDPKQQHDFTHAI